MARTLFATSRNGQQKVLFILTSQKSSMHYLEHTSKARFVLVSCSIYPGGQPESRTWRIDLDAVSCRCISRAFNPAHGHAVMVAA